MAKDRGLTLNGIIFLSGLVLAVLIALFTSGDPPAWALIVLAIIGIIVGLFNITAEETNSYLLASIAFLISFQSLSNVFTTLTFGWGAVGTFFDLMSVFVAPAAAIVAVIALFHLQRD